MPVILAIAIECTNLTTVLIVMGFIIWRVRRRRRQARWEAYIRNECALYIEEVLA